MEKSFSFVIIKVMSKNEKGKYEKEQEEKENGYAIIFNRFSINFIILDNKKRKKEKK